MHSHEPSCLARASAVAAGSTWVSDIPRSTIQNETTLAAPTLVTEGEDYMDQMKSLEKQVLLLTAEKKRLEAELVKYPATNGANSLVQPM